MIFVKNTGGGREVNMINTVSKINLSKKRIGGRGVNLNLDNVFKYTVFFGRHPLLVYRNGISTQNLDVFFLYFNEIPHLHNCTDFFSCFIGNNCPVKFVYILNYFYNQQNWHFRAIKVDSPLLTFVLYSPGLLYFQYL